MHRRCLTVSKEDIGVDGDTYTMAKVDLSLIQESSSLPSNWVRESNKT